MAETTSSVYLVDRKETILFDICSSSFLITENHLAVELDKSRATKVYKLCVRTMDQIYVFRMEFIWNQMSFFTLLA